MMSRGIVAAVLMLSALTAAPLRAAAPPAADAPLAEKRWQEHSHGLSLRPPLGSRLLEQNYDDAILRIAGEGNSYGIKLFFRTPTTMRWEVDMRQLDPKDVANARAQGGEGKPAPDADADLSLERITQRAIEQVGFLQPSAKLVEEPRRIEDQKLATHVIYFRIPDKKRGDWVLGQAVMKIDAATVALFQLEADAPQFPGARPVFEAVVRSVQVEKPAELIRQRDALLSQTAKWRPTVTSKLLHAKLVPEQWVRILADNRDVGFMKITQGPDRALGQPGVVVNLQAHLEAGDQALDSLANFFLSDDGENEIWSIRTSARPLHPPAADNKTPPAAAQTFAETGVRSKTQITVTRQGPTGTKEYKWEQPAAPRKPLPSPDPKAPGPAMPDPAAPMVPLPFLSQVELQMLDHILPHGAAMEVGFYAYNSGAGKLSFRTERVAPQADGTCLVYSRLSPEQPEQVSLYAANGKLVRRTLPNGQVLLPATRAEMEARAAVK